MAKKYRISIMLKTFKTVVVVVRLVAQSCLMLCDPTDYIAYQARLSMEFSRQEYWSRLPFPSPGDPPDPGIKLGSPALQADSLPSLPAGKLFKTVVRTNLDVGKITIKHLCHAKVNIFFFLLKFSSCSTGALQH